MTSYDELEPAILMHAAPSPVIPVVGAISTPCVGGSSRAGSARIRSGGGTRPDDRTRSVVPW